MRRTFLVALVATVILAPGAALAAANSVTIGIVSDGPQERAMLRRAFILAEARSVLGDGITARQGRTVLIVVVLDHHSACFLFHAGTTTARDLEILAHATAGFSQQSSRFTSVGVNLSKFCQQLVLPLILTQCELALLPVGDIHAGADVAGELLVGVEKRGAMIEHPAPVAIVTSQAVSSMGHLPHR